jgi:hypothetical protein
MKFPALCTGTPGTVVLLSEEDETYRGIVIHSPYVDAGFRVKWKHGFDKDNWKVKEISEEEALQLVLPLL